MKSRHNTRQNRSIVNATDDTSDAVRSSTHACAASLHRGRQPDCKHGQEYDNASRSIRGEWYSMAILTIFTAGYGTIAADGFKNLKIRG